MTFVYEHISDEDKKRIDFSKITVLGHEADSYQWVIDREFNAFLIWIRPDREPPYEEWYAFCWQGKIFPVALREQDRIQISDNKWIVTVKYRTLLPEGISTKTPEFKSVFIKIQEAIVKPSSAGSIVSKYIAHSNFKRFAAQKFSYFSTIDNADLIFVIFANVFSDTLGTWPATIG